MTTRARLPFFSAPPTSLYVHVPFCRQRCHYCDFYSTVFRPETAERWLTAVRAEIAALASVSGNERLKTVYFGGGTPSVLPAGALASVLETIDDALGLAPGCEITVEANPESLTKRLAASLAEAGVNRLSIGVQTLDGRLLRRLGRLHGEAEALAAVETALGAVDNVACDLMIGLPGQPAAAVTADFERLRALGIAHLSFYSLSIEPGTVFAARYGGIEKTEAEEEAERTMYWSLRAALTGGGFDVYELSNAARPGRRSRHNLVYWQAEPYFAAGPGAAAYAFGLRLKNKESLDGWADAVLAGGGRPFAAAAVEETIDETAAAIETVMLGLRLSDGVDERVFESRFQRSLDDLFAEVIGRQTEAGLLRRERGHLCLTNRGIDFANVVMADFL